MAIPAARHTKVAPLDAGDKIQSAVARMQGCSAQTLPPPGFLSQISSAHLLEIRKQSKHRSVRTTCAPLQKKVKHTAGVQTMLDRWVQAITIHLEFPSQ